jgi:hypothetical protein
LLLAAAFIAGIVGICSGGDVGAGVCFPELSIEQLTRLWPATLILIAASGVVLIGIWRPGVREPGRVEQP